MKSSTFLAACFIVGLIFTIVGALLKITHWEAADILLAIGIVSSFTFIIFALYEVWTLRKIPVIEKLLWTIGFMSVSGIVGIMYLVSGRRKIVDQTTIAGYDAI